MHRLPLGTIHAGWIAESAYARNNLEASMNKWRQPAAVKERLE
jgi:hypothetical protein